MSNKDARTPEYEAMVCRNEWHDLPELDEFIATIKALVKEDSKWSWARNTSCKYVTLRFDMRDGGFILTDRDERISLAQLKYQYGRPATTASKEKPNG